LSKFEVFCGILSHLGRNLSDFGEDLSEFGAKLSRFEGFWGILERIGGMSSDANLERI
jgi:hypothetical protein